MATYQAPPSLGFSRQEHWSGLSFPSPVHESEKWKWMRSVMSVFMWPHRWQPTRLPHPWDFPGKSSGVGCHCLLQILPYVTVICCLVFFLHYGFPGGKESACNAGDTGLIPGSGWSPGEGNSHPLQYSCLENYMTRGAWRATVHGVAESRTWLSDWTELKLHMSEWTWVTNSVMSDSLRSHGLEPARLLCLWNSPGKNTGVGGYSLLQGIFPTQVSNLGLWHGRQILYNLEPYI